MRKHFSLIILLALVICSCEKDPTPGTGTTYTQLTNSTTKMEYGGYYSSTDSKIYYRSNITSRSSTTYDIWRMNSDGTSKEKILNFNTAGWAAKTGGAFSVIDNKLSFYEASVFHEMLALDLTKTFPLTRSNSDGKSDGVEVLLKVTGGLGAAFVNFHAGIGKGIWTIRTTANGVTPASIQLRIANKTSIAGGNANAVGTAILTGLSVGETHSFSPDGSQIAVSYIATGTAATVKNDIYIINTADGSIAQRLTNNGGNGISSGNPCWSPNGNLIAFDKMDANGNYQIYTIKPDGTGLTQITKKDETITGETGPFSWIAPLWINNTTLLINRYGTAYRQIWKATL